MRLLCPSNVSGIRFIAARAARADVGHGAEVTPNVGPSALHCLPVGGDADDAAVDGEGAGAAVPPLPTHPVSPTAVTVAANADLTRMSLTHRL